MYSYHFEISKFNSLTFWILEVCYGQTNPFTADIMRVEQELRHIYAYEKIPF